MANENRLSAREICAIIKSCATNRVSEFTLGELNLSFHQSADEIAIGGLSQTSWNPKPDPTIGSGPVNPLAHDEPSEEEIDFMLAVENPVEWERRQLEDELNAEA